MLDLQCEFCGALDRPEAWPFPAALWRFAGSSGGKFQG